MKIIFLALFSFSAQAQNCAQLANKFLAAKKLESLIELKDQNQLIEMALQFDTIINDDFLKKEIGLLESIVAKEPHQEFLQASFLLALGKTDQAYKVAHELLLIDPELYLLFYARAKSPLLALNTLLKKLDELIILPRPSFLRKVFLDASQGDPLAQVWGQYSDNLHHLDVTPLVEMFFTLRKTLAVDLKPTRMKKVIISSSLSLSSETSLYRGQEGEIISIIYDDDGLWAMVRGQEAQESLLIPYQDLILKWEVQEAPYLLAKKKIHQLIGRTPEGDFIVADSAFERTAFFEGKEGLLIYRTDFLTLLSGHDIRAGDQVFFKNEPATITFTGETKNNKFEFVHLVTAQGDERTLISDFRLISLDQN